MSSGESRPEASTTVAMTTDHPPAPQISPGVCLQYECPLFSVLPGEIRQRIYQYVLTSSDDLSKPFNSQHHHYRPGHEYKQKYDFRLLQTCKRVYYEARLLPISLNEIVVYFFRGPRSEMLAHGQHDWRLRYRILNQDQRDAVHTVHYYAQQFYLESNLPLLRPNDFPIVAKKFVLTLRRSDWWSWESPPMSNDQLGICPWRRGRTDWRQMEAEPLCGPEGQWESWGGEFRHVQGLETLEIEFEAISTKKWQLERVVNRAKHWRFPLEDDRVLVCTGEIRQGTWEGSGHLKEDNGSRATRLRRVQNAKEAKPATCTNVVMTMKWRLAQQQLIELEDD